MSVEPINLGVIASWPATAGPGDPPIPTGPWAPTVADYVWMRANRPDLIRLVEIVESGPEQRARTADVLADVEATIARYGRAAA